MYEARRRKSAAKANTERGRNGIIHAMNNRAKTALSLALAIVGGMAAGMRCDASEWVDNPSQTNPRPAAYTVKHIQRRDAFVPSKSFCVFMQISQKTLLAQNK